MLQPGMCSATTSESRTWLGPPGAAETQACTAFSAQTMRAGFDFQREIVQTGWRPPVMRQYDERESGRLHADARDCTVIMVHEGPAGLVDAEVAAVTALAARMGLTALPEAIVQHWLGHRNQFGQTADLIEVTPDKKVVWTFADHRTMKTISSVQLIDVAGDAIQGEILH